MKLLDRLVARTLPLVPKPLVRHFADRYIAGETLDEAVAVVRRLNAEGAMATVDVLGEDTLLRSDAEGTVAEYSAVLDAIRREKLDCNVSIKLTAFGLKFDKAFCLENVLRLVAKAEELGIFVRIDMEDSSCTTDTLEIFHRARERHENVGPVIQAYMRRTPDDARQLLGVPGINVRLCKGIYNEPATVAFKEREEIRVAFRSVLDLLLDGGAYVGIATHDDVLVEAAQKKLAAIGRERSRYEFQMLLGVLPDLRRKIIAAGHRLRVYVPYGRNWYGYSVRRLKENPQMAGHVLRSVFRRK